MKAQSAKGAVVAALTLEELCRFCGAGPDWVAELVAHGVLEPEGTAMRNWRFHGVSIARAKKAQRLNRSLGINAAGVALVLDLLAERDALQRRLALREDL